MENVKIYQCKNKYNYTIKQLKIDFKNKTFSTGFFVISAETITKKAINEKIDFLKKCGFKEI